MQADHHAHHRLGHSLIIISAFLMLFSSIFFMPQSSQNTQAFGVSDIVTLSNKQREIVGLTTLSSSQDLMSAAQMRAEDMAKEHYFSHTAPDGTVAWDYFKKVGYSYSVAGENLAITNQGADNVIQGWLNSKAHRDNMLSSDYSEIGIGMASFGDYEGHKDTVVIVALYGKRASTQALTAQTSPAGGTTILKSTFTNPSTLKIVIPIASILLLFGILLEIKHIRHLHHNTPVI